LPLWRDERDTVPGQGLDPPGELQIEEHGRNGGGRQVAAAHQIVNRDGGASNYFNEL
jgi:hypothetical protein